MLQLSGTNALYALYREYTRDAAQLALVIALITGACCFLSAAGIHALMSFTVEQRRREIGIRSALGASDPRHPDEYPVPRNAAARSRCWHWPRDGGRARPC